MLKNEKTTKVSELIEETPKSRKELLTARKTSKKMNQCQKNKTDKELVSGNISSPSLVYII